MAKSLGVKEAMRHYVSTFENIEEPATTIKGLTKQILDPSKEIEGVWTARTIAEIWEAVAIANGYDPDDQTVRLFVHITSMDESTGVVIFDKTWNQVNDVKTNNGYVYAVTKDSINIPCVYSLFDTKTNTYVCGFGTGDGNTLIIKADDPDDYLTYTMEDENQNPDPDPETPGPTAEA